MKLEVKVRTIKPNSSVTDICILNYGKLEVFYKHDTLTIHTAISMKTTNNNVRSEKQSLSTCLLQEVKASYVRISKVDIFHWNTERLTHLL